MTDDRRLAEDSAEPDDDSRRQLWFRAGVAGGLIALLLGALAVFDHLSKPRGNTEIVLPTKPIAPAPVASEAGRDAPPEVIRAGADGAQGEVQEEPATAEASAPPMLPRDAAAADAPVERLESPRGGMGRPQQSGQSGHGREAEHRPSSRPDELPRSPAVHAPAAVAPAQPQPQPRAATSVPPQQASQGPHRDVSPSVGAQPPKQVVPVPAVATAQPPAVPSAVAPVPSSGAVPAPVGSQARVPAAAQASPPAAEAAGRGYVLQFGFFSSAVRAEELKARLAQAGIPAQVETRLVVGPFADRREALAAQARLREKGIDTGVLLPLGR